MAKVSIAGEVATAKSAAPSAPTASSARRRPARPDPVQRRRRPGSASAQRPGTSPRGRGKLGRRGAKVGLQHRGQHRQKGAVELAQHIGEGRGRQCRCAWGGPFGTAVLVASAPPGRKADFPSEIGPEFVRRFRSPGGCACARAWHLMSGSRADGGFDATVPVPLLSRLPWPRPALPMTGSGALPPPA